MVISASRHDVLSEALLFRIEKTGWTDKIIIMDGLPPKTDEITGA